MNIQEILESKKWKSFDLKMTKLGFDNFTKEVISLNDRKPQIYVHISVDTILQNEVLRIGKAQNGIIRRWIKDKNGHNRTFLWSLGERDNYGEYGEKNAEEYQNYLIFFAGLKGLITKVYVLNCEEEDDIGKIEIELTNYFKPIWENKIYKEKKRTFNKKFENKLKDMSKFGGALDIINIQRLNNTDSVPDVINFKSNKKWQL